MGAAEVIALEEVRARKHWDTMRQHLHERFDQWLDTLEEQWVWLFWSEDTVQVRQRVTTTEGFKGRGSGVEWW
jgi:hypothetical protein